jgi:hypothetical protein
MRTLEEVERDWAKLCIDLGTNVYTRAQMEKHYNDMLLKGLALNEEAEKIKEQTQDQGPDDAA